MSNFQYHIKIIKDIYRNEKNVTAPERMPTIKSGVRYLLRPIVHSMNVLKLYSTVSLAVVSKVEKKEGKKTSCNE